MTKLKMKLGWLLVAANLNVKNSPPLNMSEG